MVEKFPLAGVDELIRTGGYYHRQSKSKPKYREGDSVRAVNINTVGHTRQPQYVRGKVGEVEKYYGVYVFPDTVAHDKGEKPQHMYNVMFEAKDIWGESASSNDKIYVSMFEDYIEPAAG